MFRLREPVCVAAGSLQVGGGGSTGDGVSAVQQVNDELALSLRDYFRRSREQMTEKYTKTLYSQVYR